MDLAYVYVNEYLYLKNIYISIYILAKCCKIKFPDITQIAFQTVFYVCEGIYNCFWKSEY